jgi:hypothetical protein
MKELTFAGTDDAKTIDLTDEMDGFIEGELQPVCVRSNEEKEMIVSLFPVTRYSVATTPRKLMRR